jgi:hypothetical protein
VECLCVWSRRLENVILKESCNSLWRCRRVSCRCRHQVMTWARLPKAATARLISNATMPTRIPRPGVGGASSGHCSYRDFGRPNGFSSGCAGQGLSKVRDFEFNVIVPSWRRAHASCQSFLTLNNRNYSAEAWTRPLTSFYCRWMNTSTPPYVLMARCSINWGHDNFILPPLYNMQVCSWHISLYVRLQWFKIRDTHAHTQADEL